MDYVRGTTNVNSNALKGLEASGTAFVKVKRIETYIDPYGYTRPTLHIEPKLRIGDIEIGIIELRSWDIITDANIYPDCVIECEYGKNWCKISPPDFTADAIKKSNAVVADIRCPICWHGTVVSNSASKRCTNPYCGRHMINVIWKFLRLTLRMGNLPYMAIYNLWRDGRIRRFHNLWELTNADLTAIGLKGEDIVKFRSRLANAKELRLDMLIYSLSLDGVKTTDALYTARKIPRPSDTKYVDKDTLLGRVNLKTSVVVEHADGTTKSLSVKDMPVCAWRHYVLHNERELSSIFNKVKILRPERRYTCGGFNFVVGDTGSISREDTEDIITLNDGNVIPLSRATNWCNVSYYVTANSSSDDYFLYSAKCSNVNIISLEKFEELFDIRLPDTELTFSELYERPE